MSNNQNNPLIISGAPRSGTSLLYNLFDGHQSINWLVTEGHLFEYLHDVGAQNHQVFRNLACQNIDTLIEGLRDRQALPPLHETVREYAARTMEIQIERDLPWDEAKFRNGMAAVEPSTMPAFWHGLIGAYLSALDWPDRRYACLKSPDYGKSAFSALESIPEARSIVILRDPLRALDSLKYSRELRGTKRLTWPTLATCLKHFMDMFDTLEALSHNEPRLFVLRYEDLVKAPADTMRKISNWLDIPFDECLMRPSFLGGTWPGLSTEKQTNNIDTSLAERPIRHLTKNEVELLSASLAGPIEKYGFQDGVRKS